MSVSKVFLDPEALLPVIAERRRAGEKVVFACGCFELLHVGHVRYLYGAKEHGDILIVAVNTDDSIKQIKPDRTPVNPDRERYELLAALEPVDYVIPLSATTPNSLIEAFRPEVHTKGTDYKLEDIPERPVVESYGGRVELVGDPKDHSTTEMLRMLREATPSGPDSGSTP